MKVALLSRGSPPGVYGGAGVHVEHSAAQLVRLTELEAHRFGVDWATIVGHSLGGGIAMQFAFQCPEFCDRRVLVESGAWGGRSR